MLALHTLFQLWYLLAVKHNTQNNTSLRLCNLESMASRSWHGRNVHLLFTGFVCHLGHVLLALQTLKPAFNIFNVCSSVS